MKKKLENKILDNSISDEKIEQQNEEENKDEDNIINKFGFETILNIYNIYMNEKNISRKLIEFF